jgi:adenylate cyclase
MRGVTDERQPKRTLTADDLAGLVGDSRERIDQLTATGVIDPDADGRYAPGDAHRVRVVDGFEAAGVPLDALIRAQEAGLISVAYYDELHLPPGRPSEHTFDAFLDALGSKGELVRAALGAMGIAEPDPTSRLTLHDEAFLTDLATMMDDAGAVDLMLRVLRQFGEATRRASVAALETYAELIERLGPEFAGVPSQSVFDQYFLPWARISRSLPGLAEWLTGKHMTRAIDAYSIESTEAMLADSGFVPRRPGTLPAVAFADLTGFTALAEERGDATAADVALRLAELAAGIATAWDGRVVKLLGDGVLIRFPGVIAATEGSLELLERLERFDLPAGHVGVAEGPIIARDGDVFGRTVNLASRISDVAPSGALYVPAATAAVLADRFLVESVGPSTMQGVGTVELARVSRRSAAWRQT